MSWRSRRCRGSSRLSCFYDSRRIMAITWRYMSFLPHLRSSCLHRRRELPCRRCATGRFHGCRPYPARAGDTGKRPRERGGHTVPRSSVASSIHPFQVVFRRRIQSVILQAAQQSTKKKLMGKVVAARDASFHHFRNREMRRAIGYAVRKLTSPEDRVRLCFCRWRRCFKQNIYKDIRNGC